MKNIMFLSRDGSGGLPEVNNSSSATQYYPGLYSIKDEGLSIPNSYRTIWDRVIEYSLQVNLRQASGSSFYSQTNVIQSQNQNSKFDFISMNSGVFVGVRIYLRLNNISLQEGEFMTYPSDNQTPSKVIVEPDYSSWVGTQPELTRNSTYFLKNNYYQENDAGDKIMKGPMVDFQFDWSEPLTQSNVLKFNLTIQREDDSYFWNHIPVTINFNIR